MLFHHLEYNWKCFIGSIFHDIDDRVIERVLVLIKPTTKIVRYLENSCLFNGVRNSTLENPYLGSVVDDCKMSVRIRLGVRLPKVGTFSE